MKTQKTKRKVYFSFREYQGRNKRSFLLRNKSKESDKTKTKSIQLSRVHSQRNKQPVVCQ